MKDFLEMEPKVEQDFTNLSIQVTCVSEDFQKNNEADTEDVQLIYQSPRLFRKSLFFKTQNLFGGQPEPKTRSTRPIREK